MTTIIITLLYFFIVFPQIIVIAASFNEASFVYFPPKGFSFKWYIAFFTNSLWIKALYLSLILAISAVVISILISLPAAIAIIRYDFKLRGFVKSLLLSPLITPTVLLGIGLAVLYSRLGIYGSFESITMGHVLIVLPYTLRSLMVSLQGLPRSIEEAAKTLGASPLRTFWSITLPLIRPGIISGILLSFIWSFEDVTLTIFLAGTETTTLPVRMWGYVFFFDDPTIAAISTVCLILSLAIFLALNKVVGVRGLFVT